MSEEKSLDASVEAPANEKTSKVENELPAKEAEQLDEKIKEVIGEHNLPAPEETEEKTDDKKPEAKQSEKKGEEKVSEKKVEKPEEKSEETPKKTTPQPGRIDRRISKLYLSNRLLKGEEGELPSLEQAALAIQSYPLEEKQKALHQLLAENKSLRTGKDDGVVDLSEEDHEAIVEAKAEKMFQDMQGEIQEREWKDDLVKTVDAHPELDESKKEYNPKVAIAVEKLVKGGMKCSEAYSLVTETIAEAQGRKAEDAETEEELAKQKALSGAVSATHDNVEPKGKLTWEELEKIRVSDPDRYEKIIKEEKLPEE